MQRDGLRWREGCCSRVSVVLSHPSRRLHLPRTFGIAERMHMTPVKPQMEAQTDLKWVLSCFGCSQPLISQRSLRDIGRNR